MNNSTSTYLDFMRFLAAVTVFVVHANYDRFTGGLPFLWRFAGLGNDAVMVFFVLSGFVIAHVSSEKEGTLKEYFASRLARLYSVVMPALLLTITLDWIGSRLDPQVYAGWWFQTDRPLWRLASNLFFMNELWFYSVRPFSNGPFWSLGYEFWYYVIFASVFYLRGMRRGLVGAAACAVAGPKVLLLFPIWLLGVWSYSVVRKGSTSVPFGWVLFLASIVAYVAFRLGGYPQIWIEWTVDVIGMRAVEQLAWSKEFLSSYFIGMLIASHFIGLAAISRSSTRSSTLFQGPIRYVASFTFPLYLFHYPCLQFFAAASSDLQNEDLKRVIILGGTVLVVWGLGVPTERLKRGLRRRFITWYEVRAARSARTGENREG